MDDNTCKGIYFLSISIRLIYDLKGKDETDVSANEM